MLSLFFMQPFLYCTLWQPLFEQVKDGSVIIL